MTDKGKNTDFSFNDIGKAMPYRVPDGFFAGMTDKIINEAASITEQPMPSACCRCGFQPLHFLRIAAATAATVALLFSIGHIMQPASTTPDPLSVEQAFSNLSTADQEYILDTFRNEMIIDY